MKKFHQVQWHCKHYSSPGSNHPFTQRHSPFTKFLYFPESQIKQPLASNSAEQLSYSIRELINIYLLINDYQV